MVLKSRDFANYNERVERDLEILKTGQELGSSEIEESGEPITFPEDLLREDLVIKILNGRDEAIDCIKSCDSTDISDITQSLLDKVLKLNNVVYLLTMENDLYQVVSHTIEDNYVYVTPFKAECNERKERRIK